MGDNLQEDNLQKDSAQEDNLQEDNKPELMIYNPLTKHEVKRTSAIGIKLVKALELGNIIANKDDSFVVFIKSLNPDMTDQMFKQKLKELPIENYNALITCVPALWGGGKHKDIFKKPRKCTPKKIFSDSRKEELIKENPECSIKKINTMVIQEWVKISSKERKDINKVYKQYKNLADELNEDFEERMENYKSTHPEEALKKLSEKDQAKIDAGTHVRNNASGRPVKIKTVKTKGKRGKKIEKEEEEELPNKVVKKVEVIKVEVKKEEVKKEESEEESENEYKTSSEDPSENEENDEDGVE